MALARLDVPAVMLYGGSILPGRFQGHDVTIQDVFEAVGAHAAGAMSDEELAELEAVASPGAGACGGQFTANTMAMAFEILGISPIGSAMVPAEDAEQGRGRPGRRRARGRRAAPRPAPERHHHARRRSRTRSPPSPRAAARPTACCTCWRVAREAGVELSIDDFDRISERTPLLCDLQARRALRRRRPLPRRRRRRWSPSACWRPACSTRDAPTVTGRTIGEHAARPPRPTARRSSARWPTRSSRPAAWRSSAATSPPRAASSSSPATSAAATSARRACSRARRPRWPPSPHGGSSPATWS